MPFNLSDLTVDTLLDKLSSDDDFRAEFQANPRTALASLGHQAAEKATNSDLGLWNCLQVTQLASKEAIMASRDTLRKQLLSSKAALNPVTLEIQKTLR